VITAQSFLGSLLGIFQHDDGTLTVNGGTFDPGTGTGNYVITGADSADQPKVVLNNGADSVPLGRLIVGQDNYGELTIESGATLSATNVSTSFAPTAPTSSKMTVQGAGSQMMVTAPAIVHDSLMIGETGPGELIVSAGGQVLVQQGGASLACCGSGGGLGSGQITVEGEDSRLEAAYIEFRAIGGNSRVTIRDHGVVHATNSTAYNEIWPASFVSSDIDVEVTDAGSLLQIDGDVLSISGSQYVDGATARLTIRNGGATQVAGDVWLYGWLIGNDLSPAYIDVDGGAAGNWRGTDGLFHQ